MKIRKNIFIKTAAISFLLTIFCSASAYAQPNITSFSGSLINGSPITITGLGFGTNGPTILVFDDFESSTNGSNIKTGAGSATIGMWDGSGNGTNIPKYDNSFALSGSLAMRGDATKLTSSPSESVSVVYANFTATSDVFVSYWYYMPSTSDWPCYNNGICNNKLVWVVNTCCSVDDRVIPATSGGDKTTMPNLYMFGNNSIGSPPLSPSLIMSKGKWYRFWVYLHGAGNTTDHEELWVASPSSEANLAATRRINRTTQIWQSTFAGFKRIYINAFQRWCNDCAESAPTFDDVYVATGPGAQARVEIGDAATYATSKNLAIATATSWSDTSITATIRQGSFNNLNNAYLYVIDADGNVNTNGYLLSDGGSSTLPPSSGSGGDSSASGGSGCGFVKDDSSRVSKSQSIKGTDIGLMVLLFLLPFLLLFSKTRYRRLLMRRLNIILLAGIFLFLNANISLAAVNLPWSSTYNCPEWTESGLDNVNCDGLQRAGGWACDNGDGTVRREQITASANYSGGAGGKGQRHWMGDGVNNISGGLWPYFTSPQSEIWIRWYMRYEQGFQWAELVNQKILYFDSITFPRLIVEYYGQDKVQIYSYAVNQGWPSVGNGWNVIMANGGTDANGNKTSDGQWHLWEFHVKIDTNGSNGILELWIAQKKVIEVNNANLSAAPLTNVLIGSNGFTPGNGRCMYIDYDDIAISNTGPIGPIGGDTGGNSGSSGGDTSASGGSGCGFVKDDGKGQNAKGEGVSLMIMLIITLTIVYLIRKGKIIRRFLG